MEDPQLRLMTKYAILSCLRMLTASCVLSTVMHLQDDVESLREGFSGNGAIGEDAPAAEVEPAPPTQRSMESLTFPVER